MNSNRLSELALRGEVARTTRAPLFLCDSKQTQHEKNEPGRAAGEKQGKGEDTGTAGTALGNAFANSLFT